MEVPRPNPHTRFIRSRDFEFQQAELARRKLKQEERRAARKGNSTHLKSDKVSSFTNNGDMQFSQCREDVMDCLSLFMEWFELARQHVRVRRRRSKRLLRLLAAFEDQCSCENEFCLEDPAVVLRRHLQEEKTCDLRRILPRGASKVDNETDGPSRPLINLRPISSCTEERPSLTSAAASMNEFIVEERPVGYTGGIVVPYQEIAARIHGASKIRYGPISGNLPPLSTRAAPAPPPMPTKLIRERTKAPPMDGSLAATIAKFDNAVRSVGGGGLRTAADRFALIEEDTRHRIKEQERRMQINAFMHSAAESEHHTDPGDSGQDPGSPTIEVEAPPTSPPAVQMFSEADDTSGGEVTSRVDRPDRIFGILLGNQDD